ncbi:unnamed protein product [Pichia kudriavzevii]
MRLFFEFVDVANGSSLVVTVKLYEKSLPLTVDNLARHLPLYRKSLVTRVVPEYLVQFGEPLRRSRGASLPVVRETGAGVDVGRVRGRRGVVCFATRGEDAAAAWRQSPQLCVVFVPWGEYEELQGYVVVGECRDWRALQAWAYGAERVEDAFDVEGASGGELWVNRVGRLEKSGQAKPGSN